MTGTERNSDIIIMSCYAPLFVNVNTGGMQWESDLIGYDTLTSYGSPSYYAQVMFSNHVVDQILDAEFDGTAMRFFYSVTRDSKDGKWYLKLVNVRDAPRTLAIRLNAVSKVSKNGKIISLSASTINEQHSRS